MPAEQSEIAADQRQQIKRRVPASFGRVQSGCRAASGNGQGEEQTEADQCNAQRCRVVILTSDKGETINHRDVRTIRNPSASDTRCRVHR